MEVQRVQALAFGGLKELPEQFIRPAHERPENSKAVEGSACLSSHYLTRMTWSLNKWLRRARSGGSSSSPITAYPVVDPTATRCGPGVLPAPTRGKGGLCKRRRFWKVRRLRYQDD
ncbi:hypothetical protein SLA2020_453610 [Shorea laevis]